LDIWVIVEVNAAACGLHRWRPEYAPNVNQPLYTLLRCYLFGGLRGTSAGQSVQA
jgi:hypothetical protein